MKIGLLTDAPKHNLALMKISTYHKRQGDEVFLNQLQDMDYTYGSWLYDHSPKYHCDKQGGPGVDPAIRLDEFEKEKPDYDLFPIDYSLGYTWAYCPRKCDFCVVPKQNNPMIHHSIWFFHDFRFSKICLLNNNTFSDIRWRETFEEIWDASLTVIDQNGFDLRLLDEEKAEALKGTKFEGYIHFAWDRMQDERAVLKGLQIVRQYKIQGMIYVLTGYDTNLEDDLYRCQKITDMGLDPYIMPYNVKGKRSYHARRLRKFKRFIDCRAYRPDVFKAWAEWKDK